MPKTLRSRWLTVRLVVSSWLRATAERITRGFAETSRPGITAGSIQRDRGAEKALGMLTQSPAVYAGTMRRSIGLQRYPIEVYQQGSGGQVREVLTERQALWVGTFLRLLQRPDPADVGALFPRMPGEYMLALLKADRLLTGNAYVRAQRDAQNHVIGLHRLHPRSVTLEIRDGQQVYRYEPPGGRRQVFAAGEICHIRALPWRADAGGQLGIGAAAPLADVVAAEVAAMSRTATAIEQGGVDVQAVATDPSVAAMLMEPKAREELRDDVTTAMEKKDSRVLVLGGIELKPLGLTPADIKAPELQKAARESELMALGVVPVAVGADAGAYATAANQLRVQFGLDFELVTEFEFWLLRPLAQAFAATDPDWSARSSQITAAYNLTTHEGALAARTEAIGRAEKLVGLGWSNDQANVAEQLGLPKAAGEPRTLATGGGAAPSQTSPAQLGGVPRPPQGEASRQRRAAERSWWDDERAEDDEDARAERAIAWRAVEDARAESDESLRGGCDQALAADKVRLMADLDRMLKAAWDGTHYRPIDWAQLQADPEIYRASMGQPWRKTWTDAASSALPEEIASTPTWSAGEDAHLNDVALKMATTSRDQVENVGRTMVDETAPPPQILAEVDSASTWGTARSDSAARTETVRAQSLGTNSRYAQAEAEGVEMEQEWLSARDHHVRTHHLALDGKRVKIGQMWTFPGGAQTPGPGLSGKPEEDCNCRCAQRAIVLS